MRKAFQFVVNLFCIYALVFYPAIAAAQSITIDGSAPVGQRPVIKSTGGGKPQINIAPPSNGVSVNRYSSFSTNSGAIFNNSTSAGTSRTGGSVAANTRLNSGAEAKVILNDVRGTQRSNLKGNFEIFGKRADLVIANQNGITCNGCNFINASRTTLSSGAPTVNANGDVVLNVKKGNVHIGRGGATADGHLNLVGRTVTIDGPVKATVVDAIGGASTYNARNRAVGANTGDGGAGSAYAVDATQFGAMTAGQIRIIGNENGLGVRTRGKLTATSNDVSLHSKGNINHAAVDAKRDFVVRGNNGKVQQDQGTVKAGRNIDIKARTYAQAGAAKMDAVGNVKIDAEDAILIAGEIASNTATYDAVNKLVNVGEIIARGDVTVVAGEVWNMRSDRRIDRFFNIGGVADNCTSNCIDNGYLQVSGSANWSDRAYMIGHGGVIAAQNLTLTTTKYDINNSGVLVAAQGVVMNAKRTVQQQSLKAVYRTANASPYLKTDITRAKSATVANRIAALSGGSVRDIYNAVRDPLISGSHVYYGTKTQGIGSLSVTAGHHVRNLGGEFKSSGRVTLKATAYDVDLKSHGRWSHNFSWEDTVDVIAGRNINLTNAHFKATAGALRLDARSNFNYNQDSINAAEYLNLYVREMGAGFDNPFDINTTGWVNIASSGTFTGNRAITAGSLYLQSTGGELNQNRATRTSGQTQFVAHSNMRVANSEADNGKLILTSKAGNIYIQGNARSKRSLVDIDAEYSVINGTSTMFGQTGVSIWAGSSITNEGGRIWSNGNIDLLAGRKRGGNIISSHATATRGAGYIRAYGATKNVRLDTDRGTIRLTNNAAIASGNVTLDARDEIWLQRSHVEGNTVTLIARNTYTVNETNSLVKANLYDVVIGGGKTLYNRGGAVIDAKRDVKATINAFYNHGQPVTAGRDIVLTMGNKLENYNVGANRAVLNAGRNLTINSAQGNVLNRTSDMIAGGDITLNAGVHRVQMWEGATLTTGGALAITSGESGDDRDGLYLNGVALTATSIDVNTTGRIVLHPGSDLRTTSGDLRLTAGRHFHQLDSDLTSAAAMYVTTNGVSLTGSRSQSVGYMKYDSGNWVQIYDGYGRNPVMKSTSGSVDVYSRNSHIDTRRATIDAKRYVMLNARNNVAVQTSTTVRARDLDVTLKAGVGGHIYYRSGSNVSAGQDIWLDSRNHAYLHGRTLVAGRDINANLRAQMELYNDGALRAKLQAGRNITVNSTQGRLLTRASDWVAGGNIAINAGTHSVEFWDGSSVTTGGAFSAKSGNWDGRGVRLIGMPVTATSIYLGSGTGHILLDPGSDLTSTVGDITIAGNGRYYQRDSDVISKGGVSITSNGVDFMGSGLSAQNGAITMASGGSVEIKDAYGRNPWLWASGAITVSSANSHVVNNGNIGGGTTVSVTSKTNLHNEHAAFVRSRSGDVALRSVSGNVYNRYNALIDGKRHTTVRAGGSIFNHGSTAQAVTGNLALIAGSKVENHQWSTVRGRLEAGGNLNAQAGNSHFWLKSSDMVAGGNMRLGSTLSHALIENTSTLTQGGSFTAFSGSYDGYGVRLFGTPIRATSVALSSTSGYIQLEPAALKATAGDITIDAAGRFYQRNSDLTASGAISITANGYENDGSWTTANGGGITVKGAGSVDIIDAYSRNPQLWATGAINITSSNSHFVNHGIINAGGNVNVTSRNNLHNDHGALIRSRAGNVNVTSNYGHVYNRYNSTLHARKSVNVRSVRGHIFNHGGTMHAIDTDLTLTAASAIENHLWNTTRRGRLEAGRNLSAQAGNSHLWSLNSDWIAGGNMRVGSLQRQVEVPAGNTFTQGGTFTAFSGQWDGKGINLANVPITATAINLSSAAGYIVLNPASPLKATAGDITINAAGRFYARKSDLTASGAISITSNGVDIKGSGLSANGGAITMTSGSHIDIHDDYSRNPWLWAAGAITVSSANSHVVNNGNINGGGNVFITSKTNLHNDHGSLIQSRNGTVKLTSTHGNIYNRYNSTVQSKYEIGINGGNVYNEGSRLLAGRDLNIYARGNINNHKWSTHRGLFDAGRNINAKARDSYVYSVDSDWDAGGWLTSTSQFAHQSHHGSTLTAVGAVKLLSEISNPSDDRHGLRQFETAISGSSVEIDTDGHALLTPTSSITATSGDVTINSGWNFYNQNTQITAAGNVSVNSSWIENDGSRVIAGGAISMTSARHLRVVDSYSTRSRLQSGSGQAITLSSGTHSLWTRRSDILSGAGLIMTSTGSEIHNEHATLRAAHFATLRSKSKFQATGGSLVANNVTIDSDHHLYMVDGHSLTARDGAHDVNLTAFYDYLLRDSAIVSGRDVVLHDARNVYVYDSDTTAKTGKVDYTARGELRHRFDNTDMSKTKAGTDVRMVAAGFVQNYRASIQAGGSIRLESTANRLSNNAADLRAGVDLNVIAAKNVNLEDTTDARNTLMTAGRHMLIKAGDTLYADRGIIDAGSWLKFHSRLTPRFGAEVYDNADFLHFQTNVGQGSYTSDFNIDSLGAIDIYARDGVTLNRGMRGDNWVRVKTGDGKITAGYLLRSDANWLEIRGGGDITLGNAQAAKDVTIESRSGSVINTYNISSSQALNIHAQKDIIARHSVATRRGAFYGRNSVVMDAGRNMTITNALVSSREGITLRAAQHELGTLSVTTTQADAARWAGVQNGAVANRTISMIVNYGGHIDLTGARIVGSGIVDTYAGAFGGGQYTTSAAVIGGTTVKTLLQGADVRQNANTLTLADTDVIGLGYVSQYAQETGHISMTRGRIQTHNLRIEALGSTSADATYRNLESIVVGDRLTVDVARTASLNAGVINAGIYDLTATRNVILHGNVRQYDTNDLTITAQNNLTLAGTSHRRNITLTSLNGVLANTGHLRANYDIRLTANRAAAGLNLRNDGLLQAGRHAILRADRGIDPGRIQARTIDVDSTRGIITGTGAMMADETIRLAAADITTRSVLAQSATINARAGSFTVDGWKPTDGGAFSTGINEYASRLGDIVGTVSEVVDGETEEVTQAQFENDLRTSGNAMFHVESDLTIDTRDNINLRAGAILSSRGDMVLTAGQGVNVESSFSERTAVVVVDVINFGNWEFEITEKQKQFTHKRAAIIADGDLTITAQGRGLNLSEAGIAGMIAERDADRASEAGAQYAKGSGVIWNNGTISAGGDLILNAAKDIVNKSTRVTYTLTSEHNCGYNACGNDAYMFAPGEIITGRGLIMTAGVDILNDASQVAAAGSLLAQAGNDIFNDIQTAHFLSYYYKKTKRGWFGIKTGETIDKRYSAAMQSGVFQTSFGDIDLIAGRDIDSSGSYVSAGANARLRAGRDVFMDAISVELHNYYKNSGFSGFLTYSSTKTRYNNFETSMAQVEGFNVSINAGRDLTGIGVLLLAMNDLTLVAGHDMVYDAKTNRKYLEESGWSFGLTSSRFTITQSVLNHSNTDPIHQYIADNPMLGAAYQLATAEDGWGRLNGSLALLVSGARTLSTARDQEMAGVNVFGSKLAESFIPNDIKAIKDLSKCKGSDDLTTCILSAAGIGFRFDAWHSRSEWDESLVTRLGSGGDMVLWAGNDMVLGGGTIVNAGNDLDIFAGNDFLATALANNSVSTSSHYGFGVSFGQSGITISADAGGSDSESTLYTNASINARNAISLVTGNDAMLLGAVMQARPVVDVVFDDEGNFVEEVLGDTGGNISMFIGGDLVLASKQMTSASNSWGFGLSITLDPATLAVTGFGMNASYAEATRRYVDQVAMIDAYRILDIYVDETTYLMGSVLVSRNDGLRLNTGSLVHDNLFNEENGYSVNVGLNFGVDDGISFGDGTAGFTLDVTQGFTHATISGGEVIVRDQAFDIAGINQDMDKVDTITRETHVNLQLPALNLVKLAADLEAAGDYIRAATVTVPDSVRAQGSVAVNLYRALIASGDVTPAELAAVAASPEFRQLVRFQQMYISALAEYGDPENVPLLLRLAMLQGRTVLVGEASAFEGGSVLVDCALFGTRCEIALADYRELLEGSDANHLVNLFQAALEPGGLPSGLFVTGGPTTAQARLYIAVKTLLDCARFEPQIFMTFMNEASPQLLHVAATEFGTTPEAFQNIAQAIRDGQSYEQFLETWEDNVDWRDRFDIGAAQQFDETVAGSIAAFNWFVGVSGLSGDDAVTAEMRGATMEVLQYIRDNPGEFAGQTLASLQASLWEFTANMAVGDAETVGGLSVGAIMSLVPASVVNNALSGTRYAALIPDIESHRTEWQQQIEWMNSDGRGIGDNSGGGFIHSGTLESGDVVIHFDDNIIAFGTDDATLANFGRAPDLGEGYMTIIVHGQTDGTFIIDGHVTTASELAELIQQAPNYDPTATILLGSCNSGACTSLGPTSTNVAAGQLLSNILDQPVQAPTVITGVSPVTGNWELGTSAQIDSSWTTFVPE